MRKILRTLRSWLPVATVIVGLAGVLYVVVQQVLRQGANDPQVQLAGNAATALAHGAELATVVASGPPVDFSQSLAPFLIVYDAQGKELAASGSLRGYVPVPPPGVLAYALANGENRITWQPETGVRLAAVVVRTAEPQPRLVLAARSLREIELRTAQIGLLTALGAIAVLLGSLVVIYLFEVGVEDE